MSRTLRITVSYDGTDFAGWQVQPEKRTVQGVLESAWQAFTDEEVRWHGSGRTDAGVHALGQVASLATEAQLDCARILGAMNAHLPEDVVVREVVEAPAGFHAQYDAIGKRYRYVLHDGLVPTVLYRHTCWHYRQRLDAEAMHRAGQALLGEHDFRSFASDWNEEKSSVRTVTDLVVRRGSGELADFIQLEVAGTGFLYNMVRAITGTLVEVGRGVRDEGWPAEVLAAQDRAAAGMTAPPQGLVLVSVDYPQND